MLLTSLADLPGFHVDIAALESTCLILTVRSTQTHAVCPACHSRTMRRHGRYVRHLADLAWGPRQTQLQLHLHRFRCLNPACPRTTFVEPIPELAVAYARRTKRLAQQQQHVALALGGEAGARLVRQLHIGTSPDTLLRLIRAFEPPAVNNPRRIGLDDWAKRKRHSYGTLIIDLETHRPLDLLPDRDAATVAAWLKQYPTIELISRDRADVYINGATEGAPQAQQVADRFHLLLNLGEALLRLLEGQPAALKVAAQAVVQRGSTTPDVPPPSLRSAPPEPVPAPQRQAQFAEVHRLHRAGWSNRQIGLQLHLDRRTVRKYLHAAQPPVRVLPQNRSHAQPYLAVIRELWGTECHSYQDMHVALQQHGFTGSYSSVRRLMQHLLPGQPDRRKEKRATSPGISPAVRYWSARQTMWLFVQPEAKLTKDEHHYREMVRSVSDPIARAAALAQRFLTMVRERQSAQLDAWLQEAEQSGLKAFAGFARGLRADYAAVKNALCVADSNGPVEGHIHRLKLIKRSTYGRANFDLLRKRILASS